MEGGEAGKNEEKEKDVVEKKVGIEGESQEEKINRVVDEQDSSRQPRVTRAPASPTQMEMDEHYPLHIKFKSWCKDCVAGQDISDHHKAVADGHGGCLGITVSMDYCFMTDEEKLEDTPAVLVIYDSKSKGIWAL